MKSKEKLTKEEIERIKKAKAKKVNNEVIVRKHGND